MRVTIFLFAVLAVTVEEATHMAAKAAKAAGEAARELVEWLVPPSYPWEGQG